MNGPDGPEQRMAEHREHYDNLPDDPDDADYDEDLLDIAAIRIDELSEDCL